MTLNSLNSPCTLTTSKPFVAVLGVHTFGPDNSNPTRPMSFPNYSDPLVANWSSGRDSITLTPSIFDSALLGKYWPFKVVPNCTVGLYWGTNFDSICRTTLQFSTLRLCERPGRDGVKVHCGTVLGDAFSTWWQIRPLKQSQNAHRQPS